MKNYDKLWIYLQGCREKTVRLDFDDIERLVGFRPGRGFIFDKSEATQYGYEAVDYSYKEQYVAFQKIDKSKKDDDDFVALDVMGLM